MKQGIRDKVAVVGVGCCKFGENWDQSPSDMIVDAAYQAYAVRYVNRRVTVPFDAVSAALDDLREAGTQVGARGPEDVATNRFADDLERTGFLRQLWGGDPQAR